jgi:hypothetical protein
VSAQPKSRPSGVIDIDFTSQFRALRSDHSLRLDNNVERNRLPLDSSKAQGSRTFGRDWQPIGPSIRSRSSVIAAAKGRLAMLDRRKGRSRGYIARSERHDRKCNGAVSDRRGAVSIYRFGARDSRTVGVPPFFTTRPPRHPALFLRGGGGRKKPESMGVRVLLVAEDLASLRKKFKAR